MKYYVLCDLTKSVWVEVDATEPGEAEIIVKNDMAVNYPDHYCEIAEVEEEEEDQGDDYYEEDLRYER